MMEREYKKVMEETMESGRERNREAHIMQA